MSLSSHNLQVYWEYTISGVCAYVGIATKGYSTASCPGLGGTNDFEKMKAHGIYDFSHMTAVFEIADVDDMFVLLTLLHFTSGNSWAIGDPGSGSGAELVYNVSLDLGITLLDETGVPS